MSHLTHWIQCTVNILYKKNYFSSILEEIQKVKLLLNLEK